MAGPSGTWSAWGQRSVTGMAQAGREPHFSVSPQAGPVTHQSSVSCWAWLRLGASLDMCSGLKLHLHSLRGESRAEPEAYAASLSSHASQRTQAYAN